MANLLALNPTQGYHKCTCDVLDDFYRELECDMFDIATRKIGEKYFDIFCDDVGLFADDPIPSAVNTDGDVMLVGNLVFANHDQQGNTTDLTEEDMLTILRHSGMVRDSRNGNVYAVVFCDY